MTASAILAEVWRGDVLEVVVRGHVAVVDTAGRLLAAAGDPDAVTPGRSTVKPLQAAGFLRSGACDALGAGEDELALACASHEGEPVHVATARRLLARVDRDDGALVCGAQWPYSAAAARDLAVAGETAGRIHNNCSGKHAAMVAACVHSGWPVEGYAHPDHPLQRLVRAAMSDNLGVDLDQAPYGTDGCGLASYGVRLRTLAAGFARAGARDADFRRCQAAMAAHPHLVGGTGRFDTALLAAAGGHLTAKSGGAAVWAAVGRGERARAVAVKLEAGTGEWLPPVAVAALQAADMLGAELPSGLRELAAGTQRNWAGEVVGDCRVRLVLAAA